MVTIHGCRTSNNFLPQATGTPMSSNECVEFELDDEERFDALCKVFRELIKDKQAKLFRSEAEWLQLFDEKALSYFWWPTEEELALWKKLWDATPWDKRDLELELERPWDFASMIGAFEDGEYELKECIRVGPAKGRLVFHALAWPYGGTECMDALIEAFGGKVTAKDDGTGYYEYE